MKNKIIFFLKESLIAIIIITLFSIGVYLLIETQYDLLGAVFCTIATLFIPLVDFVNWLISKFRKKN